MKKLYYQSIDGIELACNRDVVEFLGLEANDVNYAPTHMKHGPPYYQEHPKSPLLMERKTVELFRSGRDDAVAHGLKQPSPDPFYRQAGDKVFMAHVRIYLRAHEREIWTPKQLTQRRKVERRGGKLYHPPLPLPKEPMLFDAEAPKIDVGVAPTAEMVHVFSEMSRMRLEGLRNGDRINRKKDIEFTAAAFAFAQSVKPCK